MIEEKELLAVERFPEITNDYQQSALPQDNRNAFIVNSRRRTSTADLMKAHLALMEKEVILPKQSDLFRLVKFHYTQCNHGMTSIQDGVSNAMPVQFD